MNTWFVSVDASISNVYMLKYGHGRGSAFWVNGGSGRVVHDVLCHMNTAKFMLSTFNINLCNFLFFK